MVQGISSIVSRSASISQVAKREDRSVQANPPPAKSDPGATFDEVLQVTLENRDAAQSRIEDLDSALNSAGRVGGNIQDDRARALSAHSLTPDRVASLLDD